MAGGSQLRDAVCFHGDFEAFPSLIAGACVYVGDGDTESRATQLMMITPPKLGAD